MTWPGTHPDTEAGKPNTTDPNDQPNQPHTTQPAPTNESNTTPFIGPIEWASDLRPSTEPPTFRMENEPEASTPQPESATPDTDSPPSADPNTDTENSSNTRENTGQPASDASDANHR